MISEKKNLFQHPLKESFEKDDKAYFKIPLIIHTDTSGILEIDSFRIEYLVLHRNFRFSGKQKDTTQEKQSSFNWNKERIRPNLAHIEVDGIPDNSIIKYIHFELQGSLAKERLVVLEDIKPRQKDSFSNFGMLLENEKSIAQRFSLSKDFNVLGFDLRLKPLFDRVKYKLELREDQDDKPCGEIIATKELEYQSKDKTKNSHFWFRIDLEQPIKLNKEKIYWLVLIGVEGKMIWQMNSLDIVKKGDLGYSLQGEEWKLFKTYMGKPIGGIFRIYHLPDDFSNPPAIEIKAGNKRVWSLITDPTTVNSKVEIDEEISRGEGRFLIELNVQSQGKLIINNFLLKYQVKQRGAV